jgi:hypothetical protein
VNRWMALPYRAHQYYNVMKLPNLHQVDVIVGSYRWVKEYLETNLCSILRERIQFDAPKLDVIQLSFGKETGDTAQRKYSDLVDIFTPLAQVVEIIVG